MDRFFKPKGRGGGGSQPSGTSVASSAASGSRSGSVSSANLPASTRHEIDKDGLSSITVYARDILKRTYFPKLDENGRVFLTKGVGAASKRNRQYLAGRRLRQHIYQHFPQMPLHIASSPRIRANGHGYSAEHGRFRWTDITAKRAAREFEVPENTSFLIVCPEIFDRDILSKHSDFLYSGQDETGAAIEGIKPICPYCKCSDYVTHHDYTARKRPMIRSSQDGLSAPTFVLGVIYRCSNTSCSGSKEDPEKVGYAQTHTFTNTTADAFAMYPEAVQERYKKYIHREVSDGDSSQWVTEAFALHILQDDTKFATQERKLAEAYKRARYRAIKEYVDFKELHESNMEEGEQGKVDWPDFRGDKFDSDYSSVSRDKLTEIFDAAYDIIEEHLIRDQLTRIPGRVIRWDGTYRFARSLLPDWLAEEVGDCLCIVFGEYGHILTFGITENEGHTPWKRLRYTLRQRCEKIGGPGTANSVAAGYSDTCCESLDDPAEHWLGKVWSGMEGSFRWPHLDLFHGQRRVTESTQGPTHELHRQLCKGLSKCCLDYDMDSAASVAKKYVENKKLNMPILAAVDDVLGSSHYKKCIYNSVPGREEMAKRVNTHFAAMRTEDERLAAVAKRGGRSYVSLFKPDIPGIQVGTEAEMSRMLTHINRGCYEDPFPVEEMSIPLVPLAEGEAYTSNDSELLRLRGTSTGESSNRCVNELTSGGVNRQDPERGHKKIMLRVHRHNLAKDKKLEKVNGDTKTRETEWHLHEQISDRFTSLEQYKGTRFPPELPENYTEPLGVDYLRYGWADVDARIEEVEAVGWGDELEEVQEEEEEDGGLPAQLDDGDGDEAARGNQVCVPALPPMGAAPPVAAVSVPAGEGNSKSSSPLTFFSKRIAVEASKPAASSSLGSSSSHSPAHVSVANVFFTRPLTVFQKEQLKSASVAVTSVFGITDDVEFAEEVANMYNARHVERCGVDQVGFGGKLQVDTVRKFLREEGKRILDSQGGNRMAPVQNPMPPPAKAPMQYSSAASSMPGQYSYTYNSWRDNPAAHNNAVASIYGPPSSRAGKKRRHVSAKNVSLLTYKELGLALKEKGLPVGNKSGKRIFSLQNYFERGGHPFSFDVDKQC